MSEILANPARTPVGVPQHVGQSVQYDPEPRSFAPVLGTLAVVALGGLGAIGGATAGGLRGGAGGRIGGALGLAAGVGAGLLVGRVLANTHTSWGAGPVRLDPSTVPSLPEPTRGSPTGREAAPEQGSRLGETLGHFQLDTHSEGLTLWPGWAVDTATLRGTTRADAAGSELRYERLSDALGAAEAAAGQQAIVERAPDSFALLDLSMDDIERRETNAGGGAIVHIDSLVANDSNQSVQAIEYGDTWLVRSEPQERRDLPAESYWVRAAIDG